MYLANSMYTPPKKFRRGLSVTAPQTVTTQRVPALSSYDLPSPFWTRAPRLLYPLTLRPGPAWQCVQCIEELFTLREGTEESLRKLNDTEEGSDLQACLISCCLNGQCFWSHITYDDSDTAHTKCYTEHTPVIVPTVLAMEEPCLVLKFVYTIHKTQED